MPPLTLVITTRTKPESKTDANIAPTTQCTAMIALGYSPVALGGDWCTAMRRIYAIKIENVKEESRLKVI